MTAILRTAILRSKNIVREAITIFGAFIAVYVYISLFSYEPSADFADATNLGGQIGAIIAHYLLLVFGNSAFIITAILVYALWSFVGMIRDKASAKYVLPSSMMGLVLLLISICGLEALRLYSNAQQLPFQRSGGIVGMGVAKTLYDLLGFHGASLILIGLCASSLSLFIMFSWIDICDKLGNLLGKCWHLLKTSVGLIKQKLASDRILSYIPNSVVTKLKANRTNRHLHAG